MGGALPLQGQRVLAAGAAAFAASPHHRISLQVYYNTLWCVRVGETAFFGQRGTMERVLESLHLCARECVGTLRSVYTNRRLSRNFYSRLQRT